jgi:uncharacterized repeat protein (TIGR01451 family)
MKMSLTFGLRQRNALVCTLASCILALHVQRAHAQLSVDIRPDSLGNLPGSFSKFDIDYRWASTTQDIAGAKIEISLADSPLDNDATGDVSLGTTAHVRSAAYSTSTKKVTYTFVSPLPAGSSGTLTLQTRFRADGTVTNGTTRPITAVFSATNQPAVSDTSYLTATGVTANATITKTRQGYNSTTNEVITYALAAAVPASSLDLTSFTLTDKLPSNSTFVAASGSGAYDAASHSITWPTQSFQAGATSNYTVQIICWSSNGFVGGTSSTGSAITNIAQIQCTPLVGDPFVRAATNTYRLLTAAINFDQQLKQDAGFNGLFGNSFTWEVELRNRSSAQATALTVEDAYPPAFIPTAFSPGYGSVSPTVVWMYYRTKENAAWQQVAGSPISSWSTASAGSNVVTVSSLGLAPSDVVTDFRWVFTNVSAIASFSGTGTIGPTTTGYISSTDRDGRAVASDAVVTNAATISISRPGTNVVRTVTDTVTNAQPKAVIDLTKALNPTGQTAYPGTTNTWRLSINNASTASTNLLNPVVADLLPASLELVPNSVSRSGAGFTGIAVTVTANYKGTGRTHVLASLLGALGTNQTAYVHYTTVLRAGTPGGTVQNAFSLLGCDNPTYLVVDGAVSDTYDLDNDGNTAETFPTATGNLTVNATAAVNSRKAIQGYPDTTFYMQPQEGESYLGGPMAYRLRVQNIGNVTLTNIVVVDVLPHVGDTGVIVTNELRGSQWTPFLTGPVSGPAGITVFYSRSDNPYRPELLPGGPDGATNDWSTVPPDDFRTVKSLKFAFNATALNPADTVELSWPMQIPLGAPTNTYSVNSFGFVATRQDTGENLLPTEPLSVRIKAGPPQPVNIGDFVWNDANTNGIQDAEESGLDGVRVELYRDGGDGHAGSADDAFVSFVLTGVNTNGASGFYQFSHQPSGNYFVRVIPAVGYSLSLADQGSDDAADSDIAPTSGYTALLETHSGDRIWTVDAGLYFTGYGTVGNYVWNDRNRDGLQNEGSADGLNDVRVELYAVASGSSNLVATQTTTYDSFGNPGYYRFDYVSPSNYALRFVAPSNFAFAARGATGSQDATDSDPGDDGYTEIFSVAMGSSDLSRDAGLNPPTGALSLGNMVWFDADGDRVFDRLSGETGINGVPLSLIRDINDDGVLTEGIDPLYGSTVTATMTGEEGRYLFSNLPAGKYFVTVDSTAFAEGQALHGLISTPGQQSADSDVDHDDNGALVSNRVVSTRITLTAGAEPAYGTDSGEDASADSNLTLDFGFLYATNLVAVGGTLFLDANADGQQGASESVYDGHLVQLWSAGANGVKGGGDDAFVSSALTDAGGTYLFAELAPGRYFITIPAPPAAASSATVQAVDADNRVDADSNALQPGGTGAAVYSPVFELAPLLEPAAGAESGPGGSADDALGCGDSNADLTLDFGFADLEPLWSVRGQVRDDYDLDGSLSDPDLPVGGVTVQLHSDPNGDGNPADGALLRSSATLSDGTYAFSELPNGRYVLVELDPAGSASTADTFGPNDNRIALTVSNADRSGNDFLDAFNPHGYFYHVLDGAIVPGGSVSVSGPGSVSLRMDGSSGQYSFVTDGTPGTYTLTVVPPPGYLIDPSRPPAGALFDPAGGADPTVLGFGEDAVAPGYLSMWRGEANPYYLAFVLSPDRPLVLNNNIPLMKPNRLGDRVWHDLDGDGAQDAGEPGLSNVTVRLLDADLNIVTSAVTDALGGYGFDNPGTGARFVQVVAPSNYAFSPQDAAAAGSDAADSDAEVETGMTAPTSTASGETNLTVDAGLYVPAVVHGYLFKDKNSDLLRNKNDSSITNVTVRLVSNGAVVQTVTSDLGYYRFENVAPGAISVLVSRVSATLIAVPTEAPDAADERRNRALPDVPGFDAYITHTVASGDGVLPGQTAETLNFGFADYPLSTSLDLSVYAAAGSQIIIELWTANEAGQDDITVYAWIEGSWVAVARVPAESVVGEGNNHYTVTATGLQIGNSYRFKVVDEAGHEHISPAPLKVKTFGARSARLELNTFTLTFDTEPGRRYQILVGISGTAPGTDWTAEYVSVKRGNGWSAYSNKPFAAAAGDETTVRLPASRKQAFFKIIKLDD